MVEDGRLPIDTLLTDERNLEGCSLEIMSTLLQTQLKLFIVAHDPDNQLISKIPKKGSLAEAKSGTLNLILVAFNCRTKPNLLEGKQPHSVEEISRCVDG